MQADTGGHLSADLKSAKCRFESDWGHDWGRATSSAWSQVFLRDEGVLESGLGSTAPPWQNQCSVG
jgi:hypothetical protein